MMAILGLFLGLGLLMVMAYRGYSVIFFAPVFALLAAALSGLSPLPTYTEIFLPALAGYLKTYLPFFLLGAVLGKAMERTGAANAIARAIASRLGARNAVLAVVLACATLTYGGISLFVVAFAVYPVGAALFQAAGVPKKLLPGTIALGAFTFTMDALPGTPQIQNTIPMKYFNTDLYAAPLFGTLGAVLVFAAGMLYLEWRKRMLLAEGAPLGWDEPQAEAAAEAQGPFLRAILPLVLVLGVTLILQKAVFPHWDISAWATAEPYRMDPGGLKGTMNNWALMIALTLGIVAAIALNAGRKLDVAGVIQAGTAGALLAVMNTASEVGFGHVIKALPGFHAVTAALATAKEGSSPLFSEAVAINLLAGITGSASGGLSIALEAFSKDYLAWGQAAGIGPELLHRVASMASGGMDTLPHNGAVITLLAITGMTHRQAYKDIFAITLIKTASVFVLIAANAVVRLG
jgi:H+/gluconate symporter-like permease